MTCMSHRKLKADKDVPKRVVSKEGGVCWPGAHRFFLFFPFALVRTMAEVCLVPLSHPVP